jgi:hypothetical protein
MHQNSAPQPDRIRRIPKRFSWIDHRLVRDHYISRCGLLELALYLVLVTVSDRNGVSFYSERSLCAMLRILPGELRTARGRLRELSLIAYQAPFYQVLGLDPPDAAALRPAAVPALEALPAGHSGASQERVACARSVSYPQEVLRCARQGPPGRGPTTP